MASTNALTAGVLSALDGGSEEASMTITGIVETALYVENVARSTEFYESLLGLERQLADDRFAALTVAPAQVLLLFRKGGTTAPILINGGVIPPHDGDGHTHFAFGIPMADFEDWKKKIEEAGIEIESVVVWPSGGKSLYFRDPDRHLVELVTPGVWKNY